MVQTKEKAKKAKAIDRDVFGSDSESENEDSKQIKNKVNKILESGSEKENEEG